MFCHCRPSGWLPVYQIKKFQSGPTCPIRGYGAKEIPQLIQVERNKWTLEMSLMSECPILKPSDLSIKKVVSQ
jgi:hypothetical protein